MANISNITKADTVRNAFDSHLSNFINAFFLDDLPHTFMNKESNFPKYNIYVIKEEGCEENPPRSDKFNIELALAGYRKENLYVYNKDGELFVKGVSDRECCDQEFLYKGITSKDFTWALKLPKYAVVKSVTFVNGLLKIEVAIELPDEEYIAYDIR